MPRGVPLTPEQLQQVSELYASNGNYSETARTLGLPENTVRLALQRMRNANRRDLNTRAIERGMRDGRKRLRSIIALSEDLLSVEDGTLFEMDGKEFAAIAGAVAKATETLSHLAERDNRNKQARLSRQKTREEILLIRATREGKIPPAPPTPLEELRVKLLRIIAARGRAESGRTPAAQPVGPSGDQQPS